MPEFASDVSELTDGDGPRGLARRRFLTFLVTAPVLTVADYEFVMFYVTGSSRAA